MEPISTDHAPVQMIACQIAWLLLYSSHCLASQYTKVDENVISDLLSFAGSIMGYDHPLVLDSRSDAIPTQHYYALLPQLISEDFFISPLPSEIFSIIQALQMTELSSQPLRR
jgi:hypothetical protein